MSYQWRFLLVEDKNDIAAQVVEAVPSFIDAPDTAEVERAASFKVGMEKLEKQRFDILILDLKDDQDTSLDEEDISAGLAIFERLKGIRFVPVVFYTAHPHKVREFESPFVKVVEKAQGLEVLEREIRSILATKLPQLTQTIESMQREYMWDFAANHWKEFNDQQHKTDIAYLMARRLAAKLEIESTSLARQVTANAADESITGSDVHPMQMYVYPPLEELRGGSIVFGKQSEATGHWIVLTPTCDFAQKKAQTVLLARCLPLTESPEYGDWSRDPNAKSTANLKSLIGDNRAKIGKINGQPERYKFLPGTFFIEDIVVDFQETVCVSVEVLKSFQNVANLDSPFAEALIGKFARYFGRLGTPNISQIAVINRLEAKKAKGDAGVAMAPMAAVPQPE